MFCEEQQQIVNKLAGYRLNIRMSSYLNNDNLHYEDETVSRPFYFYTGNPYACKDGLCIEDGIFAYISRDLPASTR